MQMNFHRKLPIPQDVKKEYPLTGELHLAALRDYDFSCADEMYYRPLPRLGKDRKAHF